MMSEQYRAQQQESHHAWDSEIISLRGSTPESLKAAIQRLVRWIKPQLQAHESSGTVLRDVAYTLNCAPATGELNDASCGLATEELNDTSYGLATGKLNDACYRLAIVATSIIDLSEKLQTSLELLSDSSCRQIYDDRRGIYFTSPETVVEGEVVFLYPGLGSAYINMLSELRHHFLEVRHIFDVVDSLCIAAGADVPPSTLIFPEASPRANIDMTGRSLASADFAVVAVLLAEYALYEFLEKLCIKPDALIGCSTGEFAAITTGGAINVHSAAAMFCRLSKRVATIIPAHELASLGSLRIFASWERVAPMLDAIGEDIHLTADLGSKHIMVTGRNDQVNQLAIMLRQEGISFLPLALAVPYHTPLVAGIIDSNHDEIQALAVTEFSRTAWACSTGTKYASDPESIRDHLTDLFTRPIALRETIQAAYSEGARIFVEVGPNDVLTSLVREILGAAPHIAVASNRASRSSLMQIHHLLAVLLTQGVPVDLRFLYESRSAGFIEWQRLEATDGASLRGHIPDGNSQSVIGAFLSTTASFYNKMNEVQGNVMTAYLAAKSRSAAQNDAAENTENGYAPFRSTRIPAETKPSAPSVSIRVDACRRNDLEQNDLQQIQLEQSSELWLTQNEMAVAARLNLPPERRKQRLLGRIAAKQAVTTLVMEQTGSALTPRDLEIHYDEKNSPQVRLLNYDHLQIGVSIAHSGNSAVAFATMLQHGSPGIDIEMISKRQPDFGSMFLTAAEQAFIDNLPAASRDVELTRLWSAKEALFKAFGGTVQMSSFEIITPKKSDNWLVAKHPQQEEFLHVHVAVHAEVVVAHTLASKSYFAISCLAGTSCEAASAKTFTL